MKFFYDHLKKNYNLVKTNCQRKKAKQNFWLQLSVHYPTKFWLQLSVHYLILVAVVSSLPNLEHHWVRHTCTFTMYQFYMADSRGWAIVFCHRSSRLCSTLLVCFGFRTVDWKLNPEVCFGVKLDSLMNFHFRQFNQFLFFRGENMNFVYLIR